MSPETSISQQAISRSLESTKLGKGPARNLHDTSPRSSFYIGNERVVPQKPSKRVSFSTCETFLIDTDFTEATAEDSFLFDYDHDYEGYDADGDCQMNVTEALSDIRRTSLREVRWCDQVLVHGIGHIKDMSKRQREAIWLSPTDCNQIKIMVKTTLLKMMSKKPIAEDDPDFCTRGLESKTERGAKIRSRNKVRTRSAVLDEQDLQREEGFYDPQFIAMASMDASYDCREEAMKRGLKDTQAILSYVQDVPREVEGLLS